MIDLDASAFVDNKRHQGEPKEEDACYYNGSKISSGIIPPEMIYTFKGKEEIDHFEAYYKDKKGTITWSKIQPRMCRNHSYAVKTFMMDRGKTKDSTGAFQGDWKKLPYKLVFADPSQDMWAIGVMLYYLLTGQQLFSVDKNEDLVSPEAYRELASWDDTKKMSKLLRVNNPYAKDLLMKLLSKDPKDRCCVAYVLKSNFLNVDSSTSGDFNNLLEELKQNKKIQQEILNKTSYLTGEIFQSTEKIMHSVFEASVINTPTCFVMLPYKMIVAKDDEAGESIEKVRKFAAALFAIFEGQGQDDRQSILDLFSTKFVEIFGREKMYLYLIDEHSGKIVMGDNYPIKIKISSEEMKKWAPVMMIGWRSIVALNGVAAIARIFLPGVPTVDNKVLQKFKDAINNIGGSGTQPIDDVIETAGDTKRVRGKELREFSQFLRERDSKLSFAGLCRVCDYTNGNAIWVTEESKQELQEGKLNEKDEKDEKIKKLEDEVKELRKQNLQKK